MRVQHHDTGVVNVAASARLAGLAVDLVRVRLKRGWTLERALTTPSRGWRVVRRRATPSLDYGRGAGGYLARRLGLPIAMTIADAQSIAGTLGQTTKMPGRSYGLDAFRCIRGSELARVPGSTCEGCYARNGFYKTWTPAIVARQRRHDGLDHPRWTDAMVLLITHQCREDPWFRWHDSGDVQSMQHLANIVEVCRRTPNVRHWLPTREYGFVEELIAAGVALPGNLVIRLSALMRDQRATVPAKLKHLPTSTVHTGLVQVRVGRKRSNSIACRAPERDGQCQSCRACWSLKVRNVSYHEH